jgi:hypothetical protein
LIPRQRRVFLQPQIPQRCDCDAQNVIQISDSGRSIQVEILQLVVRQLTVVDEFMKPLEVLLQPWEALESRRCSKPNLS